MLEHYILYNASVPHLGVEHKPYFILAISVFIVFNILPMLLLFLYPTKAFQKLIDHFPRVRWDYLHIFMDCFQGCYKNGTNNTRDYHYFAGVYLLIRFVHHIDVFIEYGFVATNVQVILPLVASLLFVVFRPYRNDFYNYFDCAFFSLLTFGTISIIIQYIYHTSTKYHICIIFLTSIIHNCALTFFNILSKKFKLARNYHGFWIFLAYCSYHIHAYSMITLIKST